VRVVLVRHPAAVEQGVSEILFSSMGVEQVETIPASLRALVVIRALQPDLIVMETEGCESDSISLLEWLRSREEAPHTILIGTGTIRSSLADQRDMANLHFFELPRDRRSFLALIQALVASSRTTTR
jgi:chemotaxis response regulator CheB